MTLGFSCAGSGVGSGVGVLGGVGGGVVKSNSDVSDNEGLEICCSLSNNFDLVFSTGLDSSQTIFSGDSTVFLRFC